MGHHGKECMMIVKILKLIITLKQRSFGASHSYDRKPNSKTQFVKRESNTGHDVIYIDSDNDEEEDENDPVDMRVTPYVRRYSVLSSLYGNSYQGRYDNSSKSNIDSSPPSIYVPTINPIRPALRNTSYLALLRHQEESEMHKTNAY